MADATATPHSQRHTVLVVDDISINVQLMVEILREDYKVLVATSGPKALQIAHKQLPDLILLDVMMPEMDGFEVCSRLKMNEETAGIPVIFVTAKNEVPDETQGFEIGALDYIAKPVSAPIVRARVRTHLELYDQNRKLEAMVADRTRKLEQALHKAEEASRAKSAFLANMTHELRTPMNKIMGMVQLLQELAENDDQRYLLQEALRAAEGLTDMLNRLLQLSALDSGEWRLRPRTFQLRRSLESMRRVMERSASQKGLDLRWTIDEAVPDQLVGDVDMLLHALTNVLHNAVLFTETGGVEMHIELDPQRDAGIDPEEFMLRANIRDTGPGIPLERCERIFDTFEIGEDYMTKRTSGAGMGLAITRRLLEAMKGGIRVASTPGEGSVFSLHLPLRRAESCQAPVQPAAS